MSEKKTGDTNLLRIPNNLCRFSALKKVEHNPPLLSGEYDYSQFRTYPKDTLNWEGLCPQGHVALQILPRVLPLQAPKHAI